MLKTCAEENWTELVLEWRDKKKPLVQLAWQMGLPAPSAGSELNCCACIHVRQKQYTNSMTQIIKKELIL
jgi:hypothetical protein